MPSRESWTDYVHFHHHDSHLYAYVYSLLPLHDSQRSFSSVPRGQCVYVATCASSYKWSSDIQFCRQALVSRCGALRAFHGRQTFECNQGKVTTRPSRGASSSSQPRASWPQRLDSGTTILHVLIVPVLARVTAMRSLYIVLQLYVPSHVSCADETCI